MGRHSLGAVKLQFYCPTCRQMTVQRLLCLIASQNGQPTMSNLTCPICDTPIELKTGLNRLLIEKLSEACASVDAAAKKEGREVSGW